MWNYFKSPLVYISLSLSMLTISLLLMSEFLGFIPDTKSAEISARKTIVESVSMMVSNEIMENKSVNSQKLKALLTFVKERNPSIISAAIRNADGEFIVNLGEHQKIWTLKNIDSSTPEQLQIAFFRDSKKHGNIEIIFTELEQHFSLSSPFIKAILFISFMSFCLFLFFLKRSLKELNPDNVIPERVSKALNTFSEGLIMIDTEGSIVFSNSAFTSITGMPENKFFGKGVDQFDWSLADEDQEKILPWLNMGKKRKVSIEQLYNESKVSFKAVSNKSYIFNSKSSPIISDDGALNGVLITLDDVSEIELKNVQLNQIVTKLQLSQAEIEKQNKELHTLATRDPLTGSLNRRAFFQHFKKLFNEAIEYQDELCCFMVDIDFFKRVNDTYGHPEGDKVIKYLSNVLQENTRANDIVGRFGGEEFCMILPNINLEEASLIAEHIRKDIEMGIGKDFAEKINITVSIGVSCMTSHESSYDTLLDHADKALYYAKNTGRNKVEKWSKKLTDKIPQNENENETQEDLSANVRLTDRGELAIPDIPSVSSAVEIQSSQEDKNKLLVKKQVVVCNKDEESNSRLLLDRVEQSIFRSQRSDTKVAIMAIDFDVLKRVNDTLGYSAYQKLSKIITYQMKDVLRKTDTAMIFEEANLSFSVFTTSMSNVTVLLTDINSFDNVTVILQRILKLGEQIIDIEGNDILLSFNAGISVYPYDGQDSHTLLRNASIAARVANNTKGRNNYNFYSKHHNTESRHQIRIESELYKALENNELVVYYQPIADLKSGDIVSLEALIRWEHPELGLVSPDDFIPIAESTGLIDKITFLVIELVCKHFVLWRHYDFNIAINLSTIDFRNKELADNIITKANLYNVDFSKLLFEITETTAIHHLEETSSILIALKNAGFKIALDDFGTGYSSLNYIKQFPIDKIKIDRSFIAKINEIPEDAALVRAIIAMGHQLGLEVVAEGVENEQQLTLLQDFNCDQMQGYFMSKPLSFDNISKLVSNKLEVSNLISQYSQNNKMINDISTVNKSSFNSGVFNQFESS